MEGNRRWCRFLVRPMLFQIGVFGGMHNQIHEIYPIGDQLISSRYSQILHPSPTTQPGNLAHRNPTIAFTQPYIAHLTWLDTSLHFS